MANDRWSSGTAWPRSQARCWPIIGIILGRSLTLEPQSVDNIGAMARKQKTCISPAAMVALSLLVSAGAVAETSGGGVFASGSSRRLVRTSGERDQVAQLLACLTEAAKELRGQGADRNLSAVDGVAHQSFALVLDLPGNCLGMARHHLDRAPAEAPWLAHLIDLPPPAASCA